MKAIGYVRVSTDKQGISLEAQAEKIKAMALVQGTELIETIVESESAKNLLGQQWGCRSANGLDLVHAGVQQRERGGHLPGVFQSVEQYDQSAERCGNELDAANAGHGRGVAEQPVSGERGGSNGSAEREQSGTQPAGDVCGRLCGDQAGVDVCDRRRRQERLATNGCLDYLKRSIGSCKHMSICYVRSSQSFFTALHRT
jgi:Resolvase, N terminal domain